MYARVITVDCFRYIAYSREIFLDFYIDAVRTPTQGRKSPADEHPAFRNALLPRIVLGAIAF